MQRAAGLALGLHWDCVAVDAGKQVRVGKKHLASLAGKHSRMPNGINGNRGKGSLLVGPSRWQRPRRMSNRRSAPVCSSQIRRVAAQCNSCVLLSSSSMMFWCSYVAPHSPAKPTASRTRLPQKKCRCASRLLGLLAGLSSCAVRPPSCRNRAALECSACRHAPRPLLHRPRSKLREGTLRGRQRALPLVMSAPSRRTFLASILRLVRCCPKQDLMRSHAARVFTASPTSPPVVVPSALRVLLLRHLRLPRSVSFRQNMLFC